LPELHIVARRLRNVARGLREEKLREEKLREENRKRPALSRTGGGMFHLGWCVGKRHSPHNWHQARGGTAGADRMKRRRYMDLAREAAGRILVMDDGAIIEQGPPRAVPDRSIQDRTRRFPRIVNNVEKEVA
jgi:hypothetical protein